MKQTETIVIGAGQAGLAMSRALTDLGHDHVILERGRVGQRWQERWDSLRLLTPNWMSRLPGWRYDGSDPDGYMSRNDVIGFLNRYAQSFEAPIEELTNVLRVGRTDLGWMTETDRGVWHSRNVVIATGHCDQARVPSFAAEAPADLQQVTCLNYRNPEQLPAGGVLVVGASAAGVQLAEEITRSGRQVWLAVGRHTRMPRQYRGRDILYWLDRIGALDRPLTEMPDPRAAMREPSLQLVGRSSRNNLDLGTLQEIGVRLTGRMTGFRSGCARFSRDLKHNVAKADFQLRRVLSRIDNHIEDNDLPARPMDDSEIPGIPLQAARRRINLRENGIRSVLWATGYRRSYPWLEASVLDQNGEIRHSRGRTEAPGLYVLGLQFMIRRKSSLIDGVGRDALEIASKIAGLSEIPRMEVA